MDNRNRKYPIIHLCLGELGSHHPENLLCLGEAGSLHPEILYCPGEEDSLHLIIYLCPGEPSSLHPEILLCSREPGSPAMPAPEEQGKRSGTGDDVPPNPFVYRVLDAARPGKSIRGLQHPQLGQVLVDLEKLITQNTDCFVPLKTNVRVIVRGS